MQLLIFNTKTLIEVLIERVFRIPLCTLVNQHLASLARKFPTTKFLKSISTTCIANWPDSKLPTILIYHNGNMEKQFVGPLELRGMKLTEAGDMCILRLEYYRRDKSKNSVYFRQFIFSFRRTGMDAGTSGGNTNKNQGGPTTEGQGCLVLQFEEWKRRC